MESSLKNRLLGDQKPILILNAYLFTHRGGPLFSFGPEPIDDVVEIQLVVESVNEMDKTIKLKPSVKRAGDAQRSALIRRKSMERYDWCVKVRIGVPTKSLARPSKKDLCTIVAADTEISEKETNVISCISTYDMQLFYKVWDENLDAIQVALNFKVQYMICSYSFLFSRLDSSKHSDYGHWSVHTQGKRQILLDEAAKGGLIWSDRYWNFDLVLHWLTLGAADEAFSVIAFLQEHENLYQGGVTNQRLMSGRFYRTDSIDLQQE
jgi:hypothetical protein